MSRLTWQGGTLYYITGGLQLSEALYPAVLCGQTECRKGNAEKLSSSQAEPGHAIKSAVA